MLNLHIIPLYKRIEAQEAEKAAIIQRNSIMEMRKLKFYNKLDSTGENILNG